ncbi:MAG: hypothetical protein K6L81_03410 [Agarilytica sp.]
MNVIPIKFASAAALSTALIWLLCSVLVLIAPGAINYISGAMMHLEMSHWVWDLSVSKLVVGMLAWALMTWLVVWLTTTIYLRWLGETDRE